MTHCIDIFVAAAAAVAGGMAMTPRSANDKEYFPQDWFADRISELGLPFHAQGRNSYPDFWVGDEETTPIEGYEIKSLAFAKDSRSSKPVDGGARIEMPESASPGLGLPAVEHAFPGGRTACVQLLRNPQARMQRQSACPRCHGPRKAPPGLD
jgi:hypothetical protein